MTTSPPVRGPIRTPEELRVRTQASFTVSPEQWHAISAPLTPTVVIAGAGSGKTELMAARVVYLVAGGFVRPDQILGLTFTTKATAELAQRIRSMLARAGLERGVDVEGRQAVDEGGLSERLEPTISTYNAYGASLLAEHGLRIGHEPDRRVMADASRFQLAQRVIAQHRGVVARLSDHPPTVVGYLLALESSMSEHLVDVDQVRQFHRDEAPRFQATLDRLVTEGGRTKGKQDVLVTVLDKMAEREELLGLVADYRVLKDQLGLIDFSDQIANGCRLALDHPDVGVAEREKFRVVLLDEYQDTSVAQARLLAGLFRGDDVASGRGHSVMAVGDPNQAIYGWRGASAANIVAFRDHFRTAAGDRADLRHLTVNRRSDSRILELANRLAQPLLDLPDAVVAALRAKEDAPTGRIRSIVHATQTDELDWLATQVQTAHDAGVPWQEIGVLVRTNKHGAEAYDVLTEAGIPVEIVGLGGLIRLPEVAQVVATLSLLGDVTDNAALLTLLAGPRWEIGERDLALLGARSKELARAPRGEEGGEEERKSLDEEIRESVAGADPTEIASLNEALEDPGDQPYSPEALARFTKLADELRHLRTFAGEPLLDLLRRIMDVTGLDIELASSTSPAAAARRENLDLFVKAVADFQAVDGSITLGALNAWLETEDDHGGGLDLAPPSESETVKLLTVHRAKGLEYDVVFLIGVGETRFPNTKLRPQWTTSAAVLPNTLRGDRESIPQLRGYEPGDVSSRHVAKESPDDSLETQTRDHQAYEELRLGYVAYTRARHEFVVSSHVWGTTKKPVLPSPYLETTRTAQESWQEVPDAWYLPEAGQTNPNADTPTSLAWPGDTRSPERARREAAAALVAEAAHDRTDPLADLTEADRVTLARWDEEIERLLVEVAEQSTDTIEVQLPPSLSATALARVRDEPEEFARELARPMPRPPAPAARFGTAFHDWVEARFGQQALLGDDELPGRADVGIDDAADLRKVVELFEAGPFADRVPAAVEAPFALVLTGQVIRGRIDAVYAEPDGGYLVVDWKTNRRESADPLQLAIYRLAWAELHGLPVDEVRAVFHYVRSGRTVAPAGLLDRAGLEELVSGG